MKFELTEIQLQTIVDGLANLPWRTAHPVIAELDKQLNDQKANQTQAE